MDQTRAESGGFRISVRINCDRSVAGRAHLAIADALAGAVTGGRAVGVATGLAAAGDGADRSTARDGDFATAPRGDFPGLVGIGGRGGSGGGSARPTFAVGCFALFAFSIIETIARMSSSISSPIVASSRAAETSRDRHGAKK